MKGKNSPEAGSSFRPAFLLTGKNERRAMSAYYGFAKAVDDIADSITLSPEQKREKLNIWREAVDDLFEGKENPKNTYEDSLVNAMASASFEKRHFILLIEGMEMDIFPKTYRTIKDLEYYMYRVAVSVGFAVHSIFGYSAEKADELAENMGYAVQLTNIIRDIKEDYCNGRIYLPEEDLKNFNCAEENLGNRDYPPALLDLLGFEAERAENYYKKALSLFDRKFKKQFFSAFMLGGLYMENLNKIKKHNFHVKEKKLKLNRTEKIKAVLKISLAYLRL